MKLFLIFLIILRYIFTTLKFCLKVRKISPLSLYIQKLYACLTLTRFCNVSIKIILCLIFNTTSTAFNTTPFLEMDYYFEVIPGIFKLTYIFLDLGIFPLSKNNKPVFRINSEIISMLNCLPAFVMFA